MRCKNITIGLTLALMLLLVSCKKENSLFNGNDFRIGNWGDPMYLIQKNEGAMSTYDNDNRLMYWDTFLGYDSNITYIFYNKKLVNGFIEIESTDSKDKVYSNVISTLEATYGEPVSKENNATKFKTDNGFIYVSKSGTNCTVLVGQ